MESARCAWRRSSGDTSLERATAKFRRAHNRMLSGMVRPAQVIKSVMLWILVSFISSPSSSCSSSTASSLGALLANRRSIINCKKPSSAESFFPPPNAISRILYTAYPSGVFSPDSRTLMWFSPSQRSRLTKRASTRKISAHTVPSSCVNSNAVRFVWIVNTPQEWYFHCFAVLSKTRIGYFALAVFSFDWNVV